MEGTNSNHIIACKIEIFFPNDYYNEIHSPSSAQGNGYIQSPTRVPAVRAATVHVRHCPDLLPVSLGRFCVRAGKHSLWMPQELKGSLLIVPIAMALAAFLFGIEVGLGFALTKEADHIIILLCIELGLQALPCLGITVWGRALWIIRAA